ncbi:hypothetical protein Pelo_15054 [Pelomyxa schiedti]|nr:hypothetical protein Pelo_15054 [Pelomyxa schiedti]
MLLVVAACEREGSGVIEMCGERSWVRDPECALPELHEPAVGLYHHTCHSHIQGEHESHNALCPFSGCSFSLLICGVLGHNAASSVAAVALHYPRKYSFVVSFGASGTYNSSLLGKVCLVGQSCAYAVGDNTHWAKPIDLDTTLFKEVILAANTAIPDESLVHSNVICASGAVYSTPQERQSTHFPHQAQIEDMELYSVACLCRSIKIPLAAVKYVANLADGGQGPAVARSEMRSNIITFRALAVTVLVCVVNVVVNSRVHSV